MTCRTRAWPLIIIIVLGLGCGQSGHESLGPSGAVADAEPPPPSSPVASPTPVPSATPAPTGADPEPSPSPDCIHDSEHGVESVTLALYFVECSGRRIPLNEYNDVPLGCRIHLNATPRDGMHRPTCSRNWPEWQVDPSGLVGGPSDAETFTPVYQARDTGRLSVRCIVDNVRSNWVFFNLVPR